MARISRSKRFIIDAKKQAALSALYTTAEVVCRGVAALITEHQSYVHADPERLRILSRHLSAAAEYSAIAESLDTGRITASQAAEHAAMCVDVAEPLRHILDDPAAPANPAKPRRVRIRGVRIRRR